MKSLHDYFAGARQRKPLMNEEQITALLDTYDSQNDSHSPTGPRTSDRSSITDTRGSIMKIVSFVAVVTIAGTTFLQLREGAIDAGVGNYHAGPPRKLHQAGSATGSDQPVAETENQQITEFQQDGKNDRIPKRKSSPKRKGAQKSQRISGTARTPSVGMPAPAAPTINDEPKMLLAPAKIKQERRLIRSQSLPLQANGTIRAPKRNSGSSLFDVPSLDFTSIGRVELEPDELARLGIRVYDMGIYSTWQEPGKTKPFKWVISSSGMTLSPETVEGVEIPSFFPSIITDDAGGLRAILYEDDPREIELSERLRTAIDPAMAEELGRQRRELSDAKNRELLQKMEVGRLVPILIRSKHDVPYMIEDSLAKHWRRNAIFWYEPSTEFLERLPAHVRQRIEREMQLADRLQQSDQAVNGAGDPKLREAIISDIKATVGEQPYLDVLRETSGALMATALHPNPAHGATKLKFRLSAPRNISLTLHDLAGRELRRIISSHPKEEGEWQTDIDLTGLSKGVYLVWITTDKGERGVQRLIVQE